MAVRFNVVDQFGSPCDAMGYLVVGPGQMLSVETDGAGDLVFALSREQERSLSSYELVVKPPGGHWSSFQKDLAADEQITLTPLLAPDVPWWKTCVGLANGARATGMRIGIIDSEWCSDAGLGHVTQIDVNRQPAALRTGARKWAWAHGEQVARLIGADASYAGALCGLAPDASIVAVAVGKGNQRAGEFSDIISAIYMLALEHGVDLINISAGAYDITNADRIAVESAIVTARQSGTFCITAVGNNPAMPIAFPASSPYCAGIGAIGCHGSAPPGTLSNELRFMAARAKLPKCAPHKGMKLFISPRSCQGSELAAVAPGVGIMTGQNGVPEFDLIGTSFAAPIVTSVLACKLASDMVYRNKTGTERSNHAEMTLKALCRSISTPQTMEGHGIPEF